MLTKVWGLRLGEQFVAPKFGYLDPGEILSRTFQWDRIAGLLYLEANLHGPGSSRVSLQFYGPGGRTT